MNPVDQQGFFSGVPFTHACEARSPTLVGQSFMSDGSWGRVGGRGLSPAVSAQDVGFFWRWWRWPWRGGQLGNSEDAEKPNKSYYDPRKWLREVESTMVERALRSCVDHSNVNWSCSQHVCMKPPLAVIFALF